MSIYDQFKEIYTEILLTNIDTNDTYFITDFCPEKKSFLLKKSNSSEEFTLTFPSLLHSFLFNFKNPRMPSTISALELMEGYTYLIEHHTKLELNFKKFIKNKYFYTTNPIEQIIPSKENYFKGKFNTPKSQINPKVQTQNKPETKPTPIPTPISEIDYTEDFSGILDKAKSTINQRGEHYDKQQERSMPAIVEAFNAVTGHNLTVKEGLDFMIILKMVRSNQGLDKEDNYVDMISYAALAGENYYKVSKNG